MNRTEKALNIVFPFDSNQLNHIWGNSEQANYLYKYLNNLDARTCVLEDNYIDKDYLIDYSKFYARSFSGKERFTKRIHFFSENFSEDFFMQVLVNSDKSILKKLEDSYLGFVIIKPIEDSRANRLIGRTILRTYPPDTQGEHRFYLTELYHVSLFGMPLKIKSLPFQTQDTAVGACATASCWIALNPLSDLFGIQKYSPFEVTEMSVSFPYLDRNFPSPGLTLFQIKNYFNLIGLETEFIDTTKTHKIKYYTSADDIVADAVRAYTKMGLPIIAGLALKKTRPKVKTLEKIVTSLTLKNEKEDYDFHAAVISGYRHKHGILKELYIHDDQIGPYSKVTPDRNFTKWINEWTLKREYSDLFVNMLVIPIYPKIRLGFGCIYEVFLRHKRQIESVQSKILDEKLTPTLYLMEVRQYKKFIWEHSCENKEEILCKPFPRFLWVVRYTFHAIPVMDYVYDGTATFAEEFCCITFRNS